MQVSMIMAEAASIPYVRGISMAMVAAGPSPGRMPTMVPKKHPSVAIQRLKGVRQAARPCSKLLNSFIDHLG